MDLRCENSRLRHTIRDKSALSLCRACRHLMLSPGQAMVVSPGGNEPIEGYRR
jgi:hypothetical protein